MNVIGYQSAQINVNANLFSTPKFRNETDEHTATVTLYAYQTAGQCGNLYLYPNDLCALPMHLLDEFLPSSVYGIYIRLYIYIYIYFFFCVCVDLLCVCACESMCVCAWVCVYKKKVFTMNNKFLFLHQYKLNG